MTQARHPIVGVWCALLVPLVAVACNSLLDVPAPALVPATSLNAPDAAPLLMAGAQADFECAFAHYIVATGMVGDEFDASTTDALVNQYAARSFTKAGSDYATSTCDDNDNTTDEAVGVYRPLSTARFDADNLLTHLEQWTDAQVPGRQGLIAAAAAYGGYSYVLMGESMCSAAFDLGPAETPRQIWTTAVARFDTAITAAQTAQNDTMRQWAYLGRARAELDLGETAAATSDAGQVQDGFVYNATYDGSVRRRVNAVFDRNATQGAVTVDSLYRNVTYLGVPDPRVSVTNTGSTGFDRQTPLWTANKYPAVDTPIPIARWAEAQLIIAEGEGGAAAVSIINTLHSRAGIPPFAGGTASQITAQIIEERRRELFLESQHLEDIKRYNLPLVPPAGAPFSHGGQYQGQTCFPLPDIETQGNPNA
jgi:hypothetical protein